VRVCGLTYQLEDENRRLRLINNQVTATNASLTQRVEALTSQLDVLQRGMMASSNDDHVQFLMEQARQFRADFESEKRDRIAAETRITELQEQLAAANTQVIYLLISNLVYFQTIFFLMFIGHYVCWKKSAPTFPKNSLLRFLPNLE